MDTRYVRTWAYRASKRTTRLSPPGRKALSARADRINRLGLDCSLEEKLIWIPRGCKGIPGLLLFGFWMRIDRYRWNVLRTGRRTRSYAYNFSVIGLVTGPLIEKIKPCQRARTCFYLFNFSRWKLDSEACRIKEC